MNHGTSFLNFISNTRVVYNLYMLRDSYSGAGLQHVFGNTFWEPSLEQRGRSGYTLSSPVKRATAPAANSRAWRDTIVALFPENSFEK